MWMTAPVGRVATDRRPTISVPVRNGLITTRMTISDHKDCRHLIDYAIEFQGMTVAIGGRNRRAAAEKKKPCRPEKHEDQGDFGLQGQPEGVPVPPFQTSHRPRTQLTTMAGVMIAVSSRRSIILKVSDCLEPTSAAQW